MTKDTAEKSERGEPEERRKPSRTELAAALAALLERVEALERAGGHQPPVRPAVADLLPALRRLVGDDAGPPGDGGMVVYAGVGARGASEIAWQAGRRWSDVLALDRGRSGRTLAALSNPARLDIVEMLVSGPASRQELQSGLDRSTAGQLNHHLRELLAAGLVEQPSRGVYEIASHRIVPLLTLLSAAGDLAEGPGVPEDAVGPGAE